MPHRTSYIHSAMHLGRKKKSLVINNTTPSDFYYDVNNILFKFHSFRVSKKYWIQQKQEVDSLIFSMILMNKTTPNLLPSTNSKSNLKTKFPYSIYIVNIISNIVCQRS
jgi:hypothetical protein